MPCGRRRKVSGSRGGGWTAWNDRSVASAERPARRGSAAVNHTQSRRGCRGRARPAPRHDGLLLLLGLVLRALLLRVGLAALLLAVGLRHGLRLAVGAEHDLEL